MAIRYQLVIEFEVDAERIAELRGREALKNLKTVLPPSMAEKTVRWFSVAWLFHGVVVRNYRMGPMDRKEDS